MSISAAIPAKVEAVVGGSCESGILLRAAMNASTAALSLLCFFLLDDDDPPSSRGGSILLNVSARKPGRTSSESQKATLKATPKATPESHKERLTSGRCAFCAVFSQNWCASLVQVSEGHHGEVGCKLLTRRVRWVVRAYERLCVGCVCVLDRFAFDLCTWKVEVRWKVVEALTLKVKQTAPLGNLRSPGPTMHDSRY